VTFESLKDFAVNEYFRRDVYVKGKATRSPATTSAYLDETSFVATRTEAAPKGAVFDAILGALVEGSATGQRLARRPELAGAGAEQVRAALLRLVLAEQVTPVHGVTMAVATTAEERHAVPSAFNRAVLQQRLSSEIPIVLASPVSGTGVRVTALEAVAIRLVTEVPPGDRPAWVLAYFGPGELKMTVRERVVESAEEQGAVVLEGLARFEKEGLARLIELGILEPAG